MFSGPLDLLGETEHLLQVRGVMRDGLAVVDTLHLPRLVSRPPLTNLAHLDLQSADHGRSTLRPHDGHQAYRAAPNIWISRASSIRFCSVKSLQQTPHSCVAVDRGESALSCGGREIEAVFRRDLLDKKSVVVGKNLNAKKIGLLFDEYEYADLSARPLDHNDRPAGRWHLSFASVRNASGRMRGSDSL